MGISAEVVSGCDIVIRAQSHPEAKPAQTEDGAADQRGCLALRL